MRAPDTLRTLVHLLLLTGLALLISWPVLLHGAPILAHDTVWHAIWGRNFAQQFWAGEWYPRWLSDMHGGLGSATFFFYPPLASYAASVFRPFLVGRDPSGVFQLGFALALGLILSGIAAYYWLRCRVTPGAALLGAAIYVIAPYHTAINLYNRGAAPEFWAFVWMPLAMLGVEGLIGKRWWALPALSCGYALLVLSQVGIMLCFSAVPVAAALFLSERGQRMRITLATIAGMALGAGLAAVYVVPAMLGEGWIHMEGILDDYFSFRHWFLFQRIPFLLHFMARVLILTLSMVLYAGALFWVCLRFGPTRRERTAAIFYFGLGMAAFFFMTQASYPFWQFISLVKFIQFPIRFDTVFTLAVAALSGLVFSRISEPRARPWLYVAAVVVVGWIAADAWAASMAFREWRHVSGERNQLDPLQRDGFLARTARLDLAAEPGHLEEFLSVHPARALELRSAATGQRIGAAAVASWRPRRVVLHVDAPEKARLTINHFYYPGWRGRIGASGQTIPAGPTPQHGLIRMDVPRGRYDLIVELAREGPEKAGIGISLCSLAIVLALGVVGVVKRSPSGGAGRVTASGAPQPS